MVRTETSPSNASNAVSHLDRIVAHTRTVVAQRKRDADLSQLENAADLHLPRGFAASLHRHAAKGVAIIAELKKASPSKGMIRENFDAKTLAPLLENAGAAALSVLTEEKFFLGSLHNLQIASTAVTIPCLRKDFMVDTFQVLEARANGADAILLIAAALTDVELHTLRQSARGHQLDVLCEVHNREELSRVLDLGLECEAIGVNSRNLKTFDVALENAAELASMLPHNVVRVAESGIHGRQDIERMMAEGYDAFLVGEALMRHADPALVLRSLLTASTPTPIAPSRS